MRQVFRHHYDTNTWGNEQSVSGPGSTVEYTENIREMIPRIVSELGIKVILDAPCGDFNWFRMIEWETEIKYIGGDIVLPLVTQNQSLYGSEDKQFLHLDIVRDDLPHADLMLCRDCLLHLSHIDIARFLGNFLRSDITYLLTSTYPECKKNRDIPTGYARELNLELPPFSFPPPLRVIEDWVEGHPVRLLALWERESLQNCLANSKAFQRLDKSVSRAQQQTTPS